MKLLDKAKTKDKTLEGTASSPKIVENKLKNKKSTSAPTMPTIAKRKKRDRSLLSFRKLTDF